jgi:hypothetical protein
MGQMTRLPTILIIDDEDNQPFADQLKEAGLHALPLSPEDVSLKDVKDADLVLIDFKLDRWPERQAAPFTLQPRDGLALATLLRRQIHEESRSSPTAFAIRTGQMDGLASPLPPDSRAQVLSRINNLEWIFDKQTTTVEQVKELAEAVCRLPQNWPADSADAAQSQVCDLLAIRPESDCDALDDVLNCFPPLHSMSQWSHGLAFLRWFLHRVLPYPCFLFDKHYLAARLRIPLASLDQILESSASPFTDAKYEGIAHTFLGPRWWSSQVERRIWEGTDGDTLNGPKIAKWLEEATGSPVIAPTSAPDDYPVVCLDEKHHELLEMHPISECVRILPDDWPPFADQAWTTVDLAKQHPSLASIVKASDRPRLQ